MRSEFIDARRQLIDYFRAQLIGPINGPKELLKDDTPHKRYLMGTLFPISALRDETDETEDTTSSTEALSNDFKPSSMSMSFAVEENSCLQVTISCGRYTKGDSNEWRREPLELTVQLQVDENLKLCEEIFGNYGRLDVKTRSYAKSKIVTLALTNNVKSGDTLKPEECLYQCGIEVVIIKGNFKEYPSSDRFKLDDEQQDLALIYRNLKPWAVGHGVSVEWDENAIPPQRLATSAMPCHEIKGFTTDLDKQQAKKLDANILSITRIADENEASGAELLAGYEELIDLYTDWIDSLDNEKLPSQYKEAKERIIGRLRINADRMYDGIERLRANSKALLAFRLANRAMLMQMVHSALTATPRPRNWGYSKQNYFTDDIKTNFKWRPFQLAFQLLSLESMIPDSEGKQSSSHEDVDLLWFPTGGGKTEAYLAVAAWEMIYRRLAEGESGGGTAVIKRYTLRLLTSQQFQRAGSLICALERIRQSKDALLGSEQFSLGLWVGSASAPNDFQTAFTHFETQRNAQKPENPFQLQSCPWCGTSIFPARHSEFCEDYGVKSTQTSFKFYCPSDQCEFHEGLPIQVVDEAMYATPPTLLIGTIDKFARLTWKAEASAFFGNDSKLPPSLVIQDELHLISGPLGTIAGIYEAGFDTVFELLGKRPKVIAATATIRSASQQVNRLFGRKVNIFPPSGTDQSDSFFSKEDKVTPGRLYIGMMPAGHTSQTAMVQIGAAMLQAPVELGLNEQILDSYWTLPIYHNSRRELGKTMTLAQDDIPARIKVISKNKNELREVENVEELSANVKGSRIPEVLAKVEQTVGNDAVDVLPCTNMISVGVDIGRLGLMLIAGQPKATAEYIQASSRVGRSKKRPPGLVVTAYSASKPRDRSHYETFKTYHQALYRYVEPTSVTPWAMPAIERALHASLIAAVRISGYLRDNESAAYFDKTAPEFITVKQKLEARILLAMNGISQQEKKVVFKHLNALIDNWHDRASRDEKPINRYSTNSVQFRPLFKAFDSDKHEEAWKTLNSMRNVDTETSILVRGEYND